MLSGMHPTRVCPTCEERFTDASTAMRLHLNDMHTALGWARSETLTDEQSQLFTTTLMETLAEAQLAWDVYRQHLAEHGLCLHPKGTAYSAIFP